MSCDVFRSTPDRPVLCFIERFRGSRISHRQSIFGRSTRFSDCGSEHFEQRSPRTDDFREQKSSGTVRQDGEIIPITGGVRGQNVEFEYKIGNLRRRRFVGTREGDGLTGTFTWRGKNLSLDGTWSAHRTASDKPPSPRTLDFVPTEFHRELSVHWLLLP